MLDAERAGFDAVVFLVDEDGYRERVGETDRAQADRTSGVRRAVGVAVRTFDAWMLADEQTLTAALGIDVGQQPDPERTRDPKLACAALLARSSAATSQRALYADLMRGTDLDRLAERCPTSFAPFARRVRALFGEPAHPGRRDRPGVRRH